MAAMLNGFFVVKLNNGRYYRGRDDYVLEKKDAYAFMIEYLAERLANRLCGKVERV